MKILATILILVTNSLISTESSPPSINPFKNQPQTIYGPPQPSRIQNSPFRPFPQRQTLPDTYGPPSNSWRVVQGTSSPQTTYGAPLRQTGNSWQVVPTRQGSFGGPQTSFGGSARQTWPNAQQTSYETLPRRNPNRFNSPLTTYGSPERETLDPRRVPATWQPLNNNAQQTLYRFPDERPNSNAPNYGAPERQTLDPRRVPTTWKPLNAQQTSYRSPDERPNSNSNSNSNYGAPERQTLDPRRVPTTWKPLNAQQTSHTDERPNAIGVSLPQTQYGTPQTNNVETLQWLRALTSIGSQSLPLRQPGNLFHSQSQSQNLPQGLPEPRQQYLPSRDSNIDFRSASNQNVQRNNLDLPLPNLASSVEVQKLELKTLYPPLEDNGVQKELNEKIVEDYLPGSTTEVPVLKKPTRTTPRTVTTPKTDQDDQQDNGDPADPAKEAPNVSIATAVAGGVGTPGDQQFYLLQPDGRLQRVVYQKTRQEGDAADEYTVDYRFHNIQGDPNYVYAPLVSLG